MIEVFRLALPITVWLIGFSAVYALQGLSCSRHWPADLSARPVLLAAGVVAIILQGILLTAVLRFPSRLRFVQTAAVILASTAAVAALWTMMPLLAASVCN